MEIGKIPEGTTKSDFIKELRYAKLPHLKGNRSTYNAFPDSVGSISLPNVSRFTLPGSLNYDFTNAVFLLKCDIDAGNADDYVDHFGAIIDNISIFVGNAKVEQVDQYALRSMISMNYEGRRYHRYNNQYQSDSEHADAATSLARKKYVTTYGLSIPLVSGFLKSSKVIPSKIMKQQIRIEVNWANITYGFVAATTLSTAHVINSCALQVEVVELDAVSENKLGKHISKQGGLSIPFRSVDIDHKTLGAATTIEKRFPVQKSYLNKVLFCIRNDSITDVHQSQYKRSRFSNQTITAYNIHIANQSMTGEIGSWGHAEMFEQLMKSFNNPWTLCSEKHYTYESTLTGGDLITTDATDFWNYYFMMGCNLEGSMISKEPTLSGSDLSSNGNEIKINITRTGTDPYTLYMITESTAILKVDPRGQISLLN